MVRIYCSGRGSTGVGSGIQAELGGDPVEHVGEGGGEGMPGAEEAGDCLMDSADQILA